MGKLFDQNRFIMMACGISHCLGLTTKNELILFGKNQNGQIGNGLIGDDVNKFEMKIENRRITPFAPDSPLIIKTLMFVQAAWCISGILILIYFEKGQSFIFMTQRRLYNFPFPHPRLQMNKASS